MDNTTRTCIYIITTIISRYIYRQTELCQALTTINYYYYYYYYLHSILPDALAALTHTLLFPAQHIT